MKPATPHGDAELAAANPDHSAAVPITMPAKKPIAPPRCIEMFVSSPVFGIFGTLVADGETAQYRG